MGLKNSKLNKMITLLLMLLFLNVNALSEFMVPSTIVEGKIGDALNEFLIMYDDMGPAVPWIRAVNLRGNIFLKVKNGISVYNQKGNLLNTIKPKDLVDIGSWPAFMDADSQNNIYTSNYDSKLQKYNLKSELIWEKEVILGNVQIQKDDNLMIWGYRPDQKDKETNILYSPAGQLIKTYDTKPLELGIVQERSLGGGKYESIVEFPDYTYKVNTAIGKYSRDILANFYDILYAAKRFENEAEPVICYTVIRVDRCTGAEYTFELPRSEYAGYSPEEINAPAPRQEIKVEYGEPVVSPLGDLYCWARTKTHYKILKWTWQGPEDAPQSLQISAGLSGLKLNWQKPVKDVEAVTGYQILRSSEVCGPFNEVTTVKKDKLSFEDQTIKPPWKYYYVVKAVRNKKFNGDSNKVYMQWK